MKKDLVKRICKKLTPEECDAVIKRVKQKNESDHVSSTKNKYLFSKEYLSPHFSQIIPKHKKDFENIKDKSKAKDHKKYFQPNFGSLLMQLDKESSSSETFDSVSLDPDSSENFFGSKENNNLLKLISKKTQDENEKQKKGFLDSEKTKLSPSFRIPSKSPKFQIPETDQLLKSQAIFQGWLKLAKELLDRLEIKFNFEKQLELANSLSPFWQTSDLKLEKMISSNLKDAEEQLKKAMRTYALVPNNELKKWIIEELNVSL